MSHNNSSELIKSQILNNGGVTPHIAGADGGELNGKPGNGDALMKLYTADPTKVMAAPNGFHRVHLADVNTGGLERKGSTWVDPKTGKEVDLADRTTHYLMDLPATAWNKTMPLTNGTINDVAGYNIAQGKPTDTRQVDFGSLFGLRLKNIQQLNSERADLYPTLKNKEAYSTLKARAEQVVADKDSTPEQVDKAQKQLAYASEWADTHKDLVMGEKSATGADIKAETEKLESALRAGTIDQNPGDRDKLLTRQLKEPTKGVPDDIVAAIGHKPVPAQFLKGEDDPAYKMASKLWGEASLNKKAALQAQQGLARYQMLGNIRMYNVIDTDSKQMTAVNANQLNQLNQQSPGRYILSTQDGSKAMSKTAAVKDVQSNIDSVRSSYSALDDLGPADRAVLIKALSDPDPSVLSNYMVGSARNIADPKQQQAVVDLVSLMENSMLLRNVQGIAGNSDMMRRAIINMLPGASSVGVKGYGTMQLDRLQKTLNQVVSGVATPGHMTATPEGGGKTPPATKIAGLTNMHTNGQTTIGWDGKQWVDASTGKAYQAPK